MDRSLPLSFLRSQFFGLRTTHTMATGDSAQRHYLDSGASCLMMRAAHDCAAQFLEHYSNVHSDLHFGARTSKGVYEWAHHRVLDFLQAPGSAYTCTFGGSGSTSGFNRLARGLSALRPDRDTVLVSSMEHHSNDLPHRKHHGNVVHIPCVGAGSDLGPICLDQLERALEKHKGRVNFVAVTAASNVTGIVNPWPRIAEMAHAHDAFVIVDGSQLVAHAPTSLKGPAGPTVDAFVFSGHKAYAPGSPGVVVARHSLLTALEPADLGGGVVKHVFKGSYVMADGFPDREEAGTPNIYGSALLGFALETLDRIGMHAVFDHEQKLLSRLLEGLTRMPRIKIYGSTDLSRHPRVGIVSFNITGIEHGLVAAVLNDYFNVAVRNECFCAHPYVRDLILDELWDIDVDADFDEEVIKQKQGMVRASLGLYNDVDDVDALLEGLQSIIRDEQGYRDLYDRLPDGNHRHRTFTVKDCETFQPRRVLDAWLAEQARDTR